MKTEDTIQIERKKINIIGVKENEYEWFLANQTIVQS